MGLVGLVTLALAVSPAAAAKEPQRESTAETVLDLVKETLGADASIATLRAIDRGYDVLQTLEAIGQGLLADGTISDDSGPVEPAGPPEGVLADAGEPKVEAGLEKTREEIGSAKGVKPPDRYAELLDFTLVLQLLADGYTLDQVVFDGIIAGGIDARPFGRARIVEDMINDRGKRVTRVIEPGEAGIDDPVTTSVLDDMVSIVEGHDPLDPDFTPKFQATLDGTVTIEGNSMKLHATGRLGTAPGGGCCLGRVRGKLVIPPKQCDGETAPIAITYNGFTEDASGTVALAQSWQITGSSRSTGGGTEPDGIGCITANDAPELFEFVAAIVGPMRGFIATGETLTDESGDLELHIGKKTG